MTCNEVITKATDLLGYRDASGDENIDSVTRKNMLTYINAVYFELFSIDGSGEFSAPQNVNSDIKGLSERGVDALIYGVCMWAAFNSGDADRHAYFTHLYNARRAGLSKNVQIVDTAPSPEG